MRGHRLRSARSAILALFALASLSAGFVVPGSPARAETTLQSTMFPTAMCSIKPSSSCPVTVRVTNTSTVIASDVIASISISTSPLQTLTEAATWFRASSSNFANELVLSSIEFGNLGPGETVAVSTEISLAVNDVGRSWGVVGVNADIEANGVAVAVARSALVWEPVAVPARTSVATILPLVSPANPDTFIATSELETLMRPGGLLDTQLTAASGASGVAVDPRIVASIVRAGESAPQSLTDWLARLQSLSQPSIQLQYADADFALEGQVGFSQTVTFGVEDVPSLRDGQLASAWSPTIANAFWAEPNTLTSPSLSAVRAAQPRGGSEPVTLFAGSHNADAAEATHVDLFTSPSDASFTTVVVNDAFTESLRAAESAATEEQWLRSSAEIGAYLAVLASTGGGQLVGGFSRELLAEESYRTSQTMSYIASLPWAQPMSILSPLETPSAETTLNETPASDARLAGGLSVFSNYSSLVDFSEAASSPDSVLAAASRINLPLLSVAWIGEPAPWSEALESLTASTRDYLDTVRFGLTSTINMVGGQASIPITIINGHPFDVTVVVRAVPSNPRLTVGESQLVTISAESQGTVKVPVSARVGNGNVDLALSMWTESGYSVGRDVLVPVRVRADWEGFGLVIIAVLFVGLVSTGVVRTLRRNRSVVKESS
jgi:hypothetical protein